MPVHHSKKNEIVDIALYDAKLATIYIAFYLKKLNSPKWTILGHFLQAMIR